MDRYDVVILGAGPGGLGAAVYCARYGFKTIVIGRLLGGYAAEAHLVENYLGFKSIPGIELCQKFREHAEGLGVKVMLGVDVVAVKKSGKVFEVTSSENKKYSCNAAVVALGTQRRKLECPNEDKYLGKGISYCASCDAPLFRDKTVGVVGGSDAAGMTALMLSEHAKKVYIIYRKEEYQGRAHKQEAHRAEQKDRGNMQYHGQGAQGREQDRVRDTGQGREGKRAQAGRPVHRDRLGPHYSDIQGSRGGNHGRRLCEGEGGHVHERSRDLCGRGHNHRVQRLPPDNNSSR